MTKVLYVAGFGRSGSTLLGNVLGAHEGVFSTGELHMLWQALLRDTGCGCGEKVARCAVWASVLEELGATHTWDGDPRTVRGWQLGEARVANTRRVLRATSGATTGRPDLDRYRALVSALYASIARVTGARAIVDSSKTPADAALLPGAGGIDPYLVHLVRDPRAVAFSQGREKPTLDVHRRGEMMHRRGMVASSVRWVTVNLLTERVRRRYGQDRFVVLPYERFVSAPRATTRLLLELVGEPSEPSPFVADDVVELGINHNVWGNRSRFVTGSIELRGDQAWRTSLPAWRRILVTGLCLPWLTRYGYAVGPASPDVVGAGS